MILDKIIIILPISCLAAGICSCLKYWWIGLIPTIILSVLFLSSTNDVYFLAICLSVAIFAVCRLIKFAFGQKALRRSDGNEVKEQNV